MTRKMAEARPATSGLPELSVVLFNVHSSDKGVKARDRQQCLREMMDSVLSEGFPDPLFVLCQEAINGPKHKIVCDKLGQKPKSVRCQNEAGVYFRLEPSRRQEVRYVDVSTLRQTEDRIGLEPNVPFEIGRLMACVVTLECGSESEKILLVSWHGPETKAKKNEELKRDCFHRLVRFIERLREDEFCDIVIIGGDFNLSAQSARKVMGSFRRDGRIDGAVLDKYTPPVDREGLAIKDYLVYWPHDQLVNVHTTVISPGYRRDKGSRPFDHPIVGYKFGNPASEAKAQGTAKANGQAESEAKEQVESEAQAQGAHKTPSRQPEE